MAITQGTNGYNVGRDSRVMIVSNGQTLELANITKFDSKPSYASINIDLLTGLQLFSELPKGWSGTIDTVRQDNAIDTFFAAAEQAWYASGQYNTADVYLFVTEADNTQSTYHYTNCALKLEDAGSWEGDKEIKQKISFKAQERLTL